MAATSLQSQPYWLGTNGNPNAPAPTPVGTVAMWVTSIAPQQWLLCNGSAISRTLYPNLFAVLGTSYGVGDGSTTFNLPNMSGRVVRGVGGSYTLASTGGADTVTLAANQLPNHAHTYTEPNSGTGHKHSALQGGGPFNIVSSTGGIELQGYNENIGGPDTGFAVTGIVINDSLTLGGAQQTQVATNVVNPYIAVNYIIKAF